MKFHSAIIAISITSALLVAPECYGRIGENYKQCVSRYGKAVGALPGLGHIQGVAGFEKSGIAVTALFDRPNRQCFLIAYCRKSDAGNAGEEMSPARDRRRAHFANAGLSEAEVDSLMATINTTWLSIEGEHPPIFGNPGYRAVSFADTTRIGGYVGGIAKTDQGKKDSPRKARFLPRRIGRKEWNWRCPPRKTLSLR